MNSIRLIGAAIVVLLASLPLSATTIVLPTDAQLVAKSPVIVEGLVLSSVANARDGRIWTDTEIAVARAIKGSTDATITVRELGGRVDDRLTKIYGAPEFNAGERVLLFLEQSPRGGYRTIDLFVGKLTEAETVEGQRLWVRPDGNGARLLDAELRPLEQKNVQRDASRFETFIEERVAGRQGRIDYGVEDPVIAKRSRWETSANFELIAEPIYRWTRFDNGQWADWFSIGTQTGYSGGGVQQLQTAMATWTSYTSANIRYAYRGARSGTSTGLDKPNGFNEILFDDPLDEIAGSFDSSTGGTVGIGGFNAIAGRASWTAPFTADPSHSAGAKETWTISEGNLTIQNGVSSANGISSFVLSEILAHEFGHTLGFGHSEDATALMYYTVTGMGPVLRSDDELAARWLYPAGASSTPAPAPPTALTASVSSDDVTLSWNDNSSDETGFRIYRNGTARATVGANIRTFIDENVSNGTHSYVVRAYSAAGESSPSGSVEVTVSVIAPPVANFNAPSGFVNQPVAFQSTSAGTITSALWEFGDGKSSTGLSASHTYATAGTFAVKLTVGNAAGTSSATRNVVIYPNPAASFSWQPQFPTTNDTITFVDSSAGLPSAWAWDFGDGTTSTQQNPSKRFTAAGTKLVKLTVMRGNLSHSITREVNVAAVTSGTPMVAAAFEASATTVSIGSTVSFSDRSTGAPAQWSWSFGDGGTSTLQNPTHTYSAPGTYTVTLTVSNASNSSVATREISVSAATPFRSLLSVAAQTSGAGGTSWRTELTVFNAGAQGANATLTFLPGAGGSVVTKDIFLAPRQSITYENALRELFGLDNAGGALAVEASSAGTSADLRVSSRTYTPGTIGTYGQSVPDVAAAALEKTLYITGLAAGSEYRTNLGLVNRSDATANATLTLFTSRGAVIATKTLTLPGRTFQQSALSAVFTELGNTSYDVLTLRVTTASASAISAYASVVDNKTQDPVYIQGVPALRGGSAVLPVVGRSPGANGTYWRSDLTVFNPTTTQLSLGLRYRGTTKLLSVGAGDTTVLADVLSMFGVGSGSGPVQVLWSSSTGPVVTSRTYTSVAGGGTYGQSIEPVAEFAASQFVPGLRNGGTYRTNVGFVNGGAVAETFTVRLLSPSGTEIARTTITLAAGELSQNAVSALFPNISMPTGFAMHIDGAPGAKLFGYASMVDNVSGDPVFFAGR